MSKGFPSIGRKPNAANPGNYVRDYARTIKNKNRRNNTCTSKPLVKLRPSTTPIQVELAKPDTSITGVGFLGIIFLICFSLFVTLVLLH